MRPRYTWMASSSPATWPGRRSSRSASGDAGVGGEALGVGIGRRHRPQQLPALRDARRRVLGEQRVEDRGAGAGRAGDEPRRVDLLVDDARVASHVVGELQAHLEEPQQEPPRHPPADDGELGFVLERGQQHVERFEEVVVRRSRPCPPSAMPSVARASASSASRVNGSSATSAMGRIPPALTACTHSGRAGGSQVTSLRVGAHGRDHPASARSTISSSRSRNMITSSRSSGCSASPYATDRSVVRMDTIANRCAANISYHSRSCSSRPDSSR